MTTGIYKLNFTGTNKVYIGQSLNCESRYSRHLRYMLQGISSSKLNEAYKLYGKPNMEILCECNSKELDTFENETIEIYNSVDQGFNSYSQARGKSSVCGINHYNSKFSRDQLIAAFFLLLEPSNSISEISEETLIPVGSLNVLARGASHFWLKDEFPTEYSKLETLVGSRRKYVNSSGRKGKTYPIIVDPKGIEYSNIQVVSDFAKEHGLDVTGLRHVLNKTKNRTTVGGWTLKEYI